MHTDPLLSYEKKLKHRSVFRSLGHTVRFLITYLAITGCVFVFLISVLNFSAYSNRLLNFVNPETLITAREKVEGILASSSIEVHASESEESEKSNSLESVTEKILDTSPEIIYKDAYSPRELLAGVKNTNPGTSFSLVPYENRIIIPRIGKNIPLVDIFVDLHPNYESMHETFMEELKKGVVRYPGTAKPGEVGNVFIFGHSSNYPWVQSQYNDVFSLLDQLQAGDEIIIYYYQKQYTYRVTDRATVKPGDIDTLRKRDQTKKELSLMTCWPVGTTLERLIIFAELVEKP